MFVDFPVGVAAIKQRCVTAVAERRHEFMALVDKYML